MNKLPKSLSVLIISANLLIPPLNQSASAQSTLSTSSNATGLNSFNEFRKSAPGSAKRQELLIQSMSSGVAATDANYSQIRDSFSKSVIPEEKSILLRLLSSMHIPNERSTRNLNIESDIKSAINSSDRSLSKEAVFSYSRLGYVSDRHQVLQSAKKNGLINENEYYGELAHGLRFMPILEQEQVIEELNSANNQFSTEVLSSIFSNPLFLKQLPNETKHKLLALLLNNEPKFPLELDSFGIVDAVKYANWLSAYSTIQANLANTSYSDAAIKRLSAPKTDPRKILAVFIDSSGQQIVKESADKGSLKALLATGKAYSESLPNNKLISDAAKSFSVMLTGNP